MFWILSTDLSYLKLFGLLVRAFVFANYRLLFRLFELQFEPQSSQTIVCSFGFSNSSSSLSLRKLSFALVRIPARSQERSSVLNSFFYLCNIFNLFRILESKQISMKLGLFKKLNLTPQDSDVVPGNK